MANTTQSRPAVAQVDTATRGHPPAAPEAQTKAAAAAREAWLRSQLPLMRRVVIGLTVFFFIASAVQLAYLHVEIVNAPQRDFSEVEKMMRQAQEASTTAEQRLPAAAIAALTTLEVSAMERRYHQANVSLLTRTWTRYLGFVTGMVLAMVGATFILGRLETPPTTVSGEAPGWKLEVISTSPGLVLAVLGIGLMLTTIVTHHEIQIQDRPIYAQGWSLGAGGGQETAPPRTFDGGSQIQQSGPDGDDPMSDLLREEQEKLRGGGSTGNDSNSGTGSSVTR